MGAHLGRHLVATLVAFAALALLAAYVGMVLAEHEAAAAHASVHRPLGAFLHLTLTLTLTLSLTLTLTLSPC